MFLEIPQNSGGVIKWIGGRKGSSDTLGWTTGPRCGPHLWSGVVGAAPPPSWRPGTPPCSPGGPPGGGAAPGARSAMGQLAELT